MRFLFLDQIRRAYRIHQLRRLLKRLDWTIQDMKDANFRPESKDHIVALRENEKDQSATSDRS